MTDRRFNADTPLGAEARRAIETLKRTDAEARALFERVCEEQLLAHPPIEGGVHSAAQRANATQMANKAVAMQFLNWP